MNEEERQAIEYLRKFTPRKWWKNPKEDAGHNIVLEDDIFLEMKIQKVLNLVDEQQTRIKELEKALIDEDFKNREKINKQNKIIDLMAEMINNHDIDEDLCRQMGKDKQCEKYSETENCKECIKQYFEKESESKK